MHFKIYTCQGKQQKLYGFCNQGHILIQEDLEKQNKVDGMSLAEFMKWDILLLDTQSIIFLQLKIVWSV